jgi:general secretion pathway protein G
MQHIRPHRSRRRGGYTLLEVLIVVAIIALIAAMVVPNLLGRLQGAKINTTQSQIKSVEAQLKLYSVDHGQFPTGGAEVLEQLIIASQDPRTGRDIPPYLEELPLDGWGQVLNYEYPPTKFTGIDKPAIWSNGPNLQNDNGAGDDINNWASATQL